MSFLNLFKNRSRQFVGRMEFIISIEMILDRVNNKFAINGNFDHIPTKKI